MKENFLPLDVEKLSAVTGNMYKSVIVVGRRSNQITLDIKEELTKKLAEFAPAHDNLEEIIENREQIEISKFYERKPKPNILAVEGVMGGDVYFRNALNPDETNAPELGPA
ncbi:MAG: DNA-directed RNA polymerase subunit omega [Bacteroidia bacterium]|nr:DNA-directed RNA polymerase subunit omega [Bacteroidia bacterium]